MTAMVHSGCLSSPRPRHESLRQAILNGAALLHPERCVLFFSIHAQIDSINMPITDPKLGFIGAGMMSSAMINGVIAAKVRRLRLLCTVGRYAF